MALTARAAQALRRLPLRVAIFYIAALALAVARRDRWTLVSATRPDDLEKLLALAGDARSVAEIGTGPGWTTVALALCDRERTIVSFDPEGRSAEAYARLVRKGTRDRIRFVRAAGAEGALHADPVDFVFLDSSHELEETKESFGAWEPHLRPGGVVVFHDYGNPIYPGVEQAVAELALDGTPDGNVYVWRKPE